MEMTHGNDPCLVHSKCSVNVSLYFYYYRPLKETEYALRFKPCDGKSASFERATPGLGQLLSMHLISGFRRVNLC